MIIKTKGIVLKQIKFSDMGVIVKIFTEKNGIQSFFVRGLNSRKSNKKSALYQPLSLLNLVTNISEKKSMHNISDVELSYTYTSIVDDMKKRSLLIFINELLYKCLQEETGNEALFNWIYNTLIWLDIKDNDYANFHLVFMLQLSKFMGFFPVSKSDSDKVVFDFTEGAFTNRTPPHANYITGEIASSLLKLHMSTFDSMNEVKINRELRSHILEALITYYNFHVPSLGEFKSLEILKVVFN